MASRVERMMGLSWRTSWLARWALSALLLIPSAGPVAHVSAEQASTEAPPPPTLDDPAPGQPPTFAAAG
jgi:hypothetical protein